MQARGLPVWGWYPEGHKWVKLRLDVDGSIHVVGYVDELGDIGDVTIAAVADGHFLSWSAGLGYWQNRLLAEGDIPAEIARDTEVDDAFALAIAKALLTAQGDIITRNDTVPKRLALGTEGYHLTAGALEPAWTAPPDVGEGHILFLALDYDSIEAGTWALAPHATFYFYFALINTSEADADALIYKAYLQGGTYTLLVVGTTSSVQGIIDVDINDTEIASIDMYSAVAVKNARKVVTDIAIATSGLYSITFRIDGRNASSTVYGFHFNYLALWRTA